MNASPTGIVPPLFHARSRTDTAPWYRQPWLWFVISLPAISVVFSFATLYVAITHADTVVPHEENEAVYAIPGKTGSGGERDRASFEALPTRDRAAAATGEAATVSPRPQNIP